MFADRESLLDCCSRSLVRLTEVELGRVIDLPGSLQGECSGTPMISSPILIGIAAAFMVRGLANAVLEYSPAASRCWLAFWAEIWKCARRGSPGSALNGRLATLISYIEAYCGRKISLAGPVQARL
jgi:hypothetical protein